MTMTECRSDVTMTKIPKKQTRRSRKIGKVKLLIARKLKDISFAKGGISGQKLYTREEYGELAMDEVRSFLTGRRLAEYIGKVSADPLPLWQWDKLLREYVDRRREEAAQNDDTENEVYYVVD